MFKSSATVMPVTYDALIHMSLGDVLGSLVDFAFYMALMLFVFIILFAITGLMRPPKRNESHNVDRGSRIVELRAEQERPLQERSVLSTSDAKFQYFLTSEDLQQLSFENLGFGATRLYKVDELRALALKKYGQLEFQKKKDAQINRLLNKQAREAEASAREAEDSESRKALIGHFGPLISSSDARAVTKIQSSLIRKCKQRVGCVQSGTPNSFRLEVPNVSKELFALLINRPSDPELRSVPKRGAYHNTSVDCTSLFGIATLTDFETEVDGIFYVLSERVELKYKPSGSLVVLYFQSRFKDDNDVDD